MASKKSRRLNKKHAQRFVAKVRKADNASNGPKNIQDCKNKETTLISTSADSVSADSSAQDQASISSLSQSPQNLAVGSIAESSGKSTSAPATHVDNNSLERNNVLTSTLTDAKNNTKTVTENRDYGRLTANGAQSLVGGPDGEGSTCTIPTAENSLEVEDSAAANALKLCWWRELSDAEKHRIAENGTDKNLAPQVHSFMTKERTRPVLSDAGKENSGGSKFSTSKQPEKPRDCSGARRLYRQRMLLKAKEELGDKLGAEEGKLLDSTNTVVNIQERSADLKMPKKDLLSITRDRSRVELSGLYRSAFRVRYKQLVRNTREKRAHITRNTAISPGNKSLNGDSVSCRKSEKKDLTSSNATDSIDDNQSSKPDTIDTEETADTAPNMGTKTSGEQKVDAQPVEEIPTEPVAEMKSDKGKTTVPFISSHKESLTVDMTTGEIECGDLISPTVPCRDLLEAFDEKATPREQVMEVPKSTTTKSYKLLVLFTVTFIILALAATSPLCLDGILNNIQRNHTKADHSTSEMIRDETTDVCENENFDGTRIICDAQQ